MYFFKSIDRNSNIKYSRLSSIKTSSNFTIFGCLSSFSNEISLLIQWINKKNIYFMTIETMLMRLTKSMTQKKKQHVWIQTEWLSMECLHHLLLSGFFSSPQFDQFDDFFLCIQHHTYLTNKYENRWFIFCTWKFPHIKLFSHAHYITQCFHESYLPSPIFSIFIKSSILMVFFCEQWPDEMVFFFGKLPICYTSV